jgi:hypothetical protein
MNDLLFIRFDHELDATYPDHGNTWGQARRGQGGLPRAACGLTEVGADGEQDWTVHNLVMI